MIEYKTSGTCSKKINFELKNGKVHSVSFEDGCDGNLKALGLLAEGMDANELAAKFSGLCCGRKKTSCADQLARAIAKAIAKAIAPATAPATTENTAAAPVETPADAENLTAAPADAADKK